MILKSHLFVQIVDRDDFAAHVVDPQYAVGVIAHDGLKLNDGRDIAHILLTRNGVSQLVDDDPYRFLTVSGTAHPTLNYPTVLEITVGNENAVDAGVGGSGVEDQPGRFPVDL